MAEVEEKNKGGAPLGNKHAVKGKRWQKALERALARSANSDVDGGLDKVADVVVAAALGNDMEAIKEIGNRMDGRSVQQIAGPEGESLFGELVAAADKLREAIRG